MHRLLLPLAVCLLLSVACRKQPPAPPPQADAGQVAQPSVSPPPSGASTMEDEFVEIRARILPAVNARVPSALRDKLKFAPQMDAHGRVVALIPESWVMADAPGKVRPPPEDNLGATTAMAFGSGCDGRCTPKDWAEAFDKVEVKSLPVQQIETDEPIGNSGRVVVARAGEVRYIAAGIWNPGASRYFYCHATLEGPALEALNAFVGACRGMDVRRWE